MFWSITLALISICFILFNINVAFESKIFVKFSDKILRVSKKVKRENEKAGRESEKETEKSL